MKNKKAVLGKAITTLPVLVVIIILLLVYLFISGITSSFSPLIKRPSTISYQDSILLKTISADINNEKKEILLLDAVIMSIKGELPNEQINSEIEKYLNEENNCIIVLKKYHHVTDIVAGLVYLENRVYPFQQVFSFILENPSNPSSTTLKKQADLVINNIQYPLPKSFSRILENPEKIYSVEIEIKDNYPHEIISYQGGCKYE